MEKNLKNIYFIMVFFVPISIACLVALSGQRSEVSSMNNQLRQMQFELSDIADSISQTEEKESERLLLDYCFLYKEDKEALVLKEEEGIDEQDILVKVQVYLREYTSDTKVYLVDGKMEYETTKQSAYFETNDWVDEDINYVKIVNGDQVTVEKLEWN